MARRVCRGPANPLVMMRAKNLCGPFFQNTGPACVKGLGNAYAPGGPLTGAKPIRGRMADENTMEMVFTACVDVVAGPGTYYTVDGGVPIELALPGNVNGDGKTWHWTLSTPVQPGEVILWSYVGDGYIVDCEESEDIGEYLNVPVANGLVLAGDFILLETGGMSIILLEDQSGPDDEDGIKLEDAV